MPFLQVRRDVIKIQDFSDPLMEQRGRKQIMRRNGKRNKIANKRSVLVEGVSFSALLPLR